MKNTISPEYQQTLDSLSETLRSSRRAEMTENVVELRPLKNYVEIEVCNSNLQRSMRWI